jgi:sulfatase maturation enzyme AslB (radical SAM superfamily)
MSRSPLFVKYRTKSGNYYLFDANTNEIVRIAEIIYKILDDYQVLTTEELLRKYLPIEDSAIRSAVANLDLLQLRGIARRHTPQLPFRAGRVLYDEADQPLEQFLQHHRQMLTLELTQECNLRCMYCCFAGHYPNFRNHASKSISFDTAAKAVQDFVVHQSEECSIGFYGGEALLEFDLLKRIVLFAEECASKNGKVAVFHLTTNGTLLSDEVIHFLVAHQFRVMISFDGSRESHDRYRVFPGNQFSGGKSGSYDVVVGGIERFAELYPNYPYRSIALTLTATSDFDEISASLARMQHMFSTITVSYIREPPTSLKPVSANAVSVSLAGSASNVAVRNGCSRSNQPSCDTSTATGTTEMSVDSAVSKRRTHVTEYVPEYRNWMGETWRNFQASYSRFMQEDLPNLTDVDARTSFPCSLLASDVMAIHLREVPSAAHCTSAYRCIPGVVRLFCSCEGMLYPCERTERGELFQLGDANSGVQVGKALRLMELARLLGDCGNCVAKKICSLCPYAVTESGASRGADAGEFRRGCQRTIDNLANRLARYTEAMEANHKFIDQLMAGASGDNWLKRIRFAPVVEENQNVELGVESVDLTTERDASQCQLE